MPSPGRRPHHESAENRKRQYCRFGCGVERSAGMFDTPGYIDRDQAEIVNDPRGFQILEMPRKRIGGYGKIRQTSTFFAAGWRANTDFQILLYQSDPLLPDPREIAKVTDYTVSYACKGNETYMIQKEHAKMMALCSNDVTSDKSDLRRLCRKILNHFRKNKLVSKQESLVINTGLPLHDCSEMFVTVSLSGYRRISQLGSKHILSMYSHRQGQDEINLDEYVRKTENGKVPHYTGIYYTPSFPPSEQYSKFLLLVYKPWRSIFVTKEKDLVQECTEFMVRYSFQFCVVFCEESVA